MIQKAVASFIVFYLIAFFIGGWGDIILDSFGAKCSIRFRIAFGGCLMMLLGMFACFVGSLFGMSTTLFIFLTAFAISLIGILGVIARKRLGIRIIYETDRGLRLPDIVCLCIAAVIVVYQIYAVIHNQSDNPQVLRGLGIATVVYDTGRLFVAEPVNLFIGAVSAAIRVHPLAFIYGIIPVPLILLYYLCSFEAVRTVCGTWHKTVIAFMTVVMLNTWGYQSEKLIPVTLLLSWFGFGVFLVHGVLNVSAVILIRYLQTARQGVNIEEENENEDEYSEEWDMKKHKIVNARNLAIGLGALALILVMTVFVLNNKINRLYAATVNLQEDMNSRCSIYEFKPDGDVSEGYLIKDSDGKITFIGGGGEENADALGTFLEKYGNNVENWYVYGNDDEDAGALKALVSEGVVSPDNVYVTERKEIKEFK